MREFTQCASGNEQGLWEDLTKGKFWSPKGHTQSSGYFWMAPLWE